MDGWYEGSLEQRGMTMEAALQCTKDTKKSRAPGACVDDLSFTLPFLLRSGIFRAALRALVAYHLERGVLLSHYANSGKFAATENLGTGA